MLQNYHHQPRPRINFSTTGAPSRTLVLKSDLISALQALARQLKVSLRTVFLSAYLDLIATETREQNVTVGLVANGRSERLSNPFKSLGLFWYMVPFYHAISPIDKISQIKSVQDKLSGLEPYVGYPLNNILKDQQQVELFFATLNFVHFHNITYLGRTSVTDVEILDQKEHDKFHFSLNTTVLVSPLDRHIELRVEYDDRYFEIETIAVILNRYLEILERLISKNRK